MASRILWLCENVIKCFNTSYAAIIIHIVICILMTDGKRRGQTMCLYLYMYKCIFMYHARFMRHWCFVRPRDHQASTLAACASSLLPCIAYVRQESGPKAANGSYIPCGTFKPMKIMRTCTGMNFSHVIYHVIAQRIISLLCTPHRLLIPCHGIAGMGGGRNGSKQSSRRNI